MAIEIGRYEATKSNAQITSGNSELFFIDKADQDARARWGSFNNLEIVNDSASDVFVDLDGLSTRRKKLFARSTMVIKSDQGIFWDTIKLTEDSSGTINADEIKLTGRIVNRVPEGAFK